MGSYSIWVGEVSGISQPAAEVVVRASPAEHQRETEVTMMTSKELTPCHL